MAMRNGAALAAELARRHDVRADSDPYPRMAAGMALLAFDVVLERWQPGDDERRLAALTDEPAAVARALERKLVAQHVEQRGRRLRPRFDGAAVHGEGRHRRSPREPR